jgi:hypothetical protein
MMLPGVLAEIAEVAGDDAALAIAQARGGTQVYVPPVPPEDHWLCQLVGLKAARDIADLLTCGVGGRRLEVPLGPAGHAANIRAKVDAMLRDGASERDIALATRYTTRAIRRRRAKLGLESDDGQMSLF